MPASPSALAITALVIAFTTKVDVTKSLKEGEPVLTVDDEFEVGDAYDPTFEISAEGKGDAPDGVAVALEELPEEVTGITGGKTMIDQVDTTQKMDGRNAWSFHAWNFPSAA
jgi:hypothetical protein